MNPPSIANGGSDIANVLPATVAHASHHLAQYQPAQSAEIVDESAPTPSHQAATESRRVTEPATDLLLQA